MKIALLGYGKMGKTIEQVALENGHEISLIIDISNKADLTSENLRKAEVAIEFSNPVAAYENISACLTAGVPVVCGTTGWLDKLTEVQQLCNKRNGAFFYASNFSIGVNILFEINRHLAKMMNNFPEYQVDLEEVHHTQKLDAPSGTAISLADDILDIIERKSGWVLDENGNETKGEDEFSIFSKRIDEVPGTHTVSYSSEIDTISIRHVAHSRIGFARGAVKAAEWIVGKKGCFGMKDLLGF
jgi:4-hydroxy-tetrahydrodipicolinate reductase